MDRNYWRALINKKTEVQPPAANIPEIVKQLKQRTEERRLHATRNHESRQIVCKTVVRNKSNPHDLRHVSLSETDAISLLPLAC
jgi:hypothetical protein